MVKVSVYYKSRPLKVVSVHQEPPSILQDPPLTSHKGQLPLTRVPSSGSIWTASTSSDPIPADGSYKISLIATVLPSDCHPPSRKEKTLAVQSQVNLYLCQQSSLVLSFLGTISDKGIVKLIFCWLLYQVFCLVTNLVSCMFINDWPSKCCHFF